MSPFVNKKIPFVITLAVLLLSGLFTPGCKDSFEPFRENDRYFFSIYGYLDASADTQWVRVMPVREEFFLDPDRSVDVTVILEDVESGETAVMNDSLFSYAHGVFATNFWTTMSLYPGRTYRLAAHQSDGRSSWAKVKLPKDFPTPFVRLVDGSQVYIRVEGVEHLADVQTVYHIHSERTGEVIVGGVPHLQDSVRTPSNDFEIVFNLEDDDEEYLDRFGLTSNSPPSPFAIIKSQVFIASAGPDWHHFPSIDENVISLPEGISNIRDGVGYLAGIVSKTVPLQNCYDESALVYIPCPLEPSPW